MTAAEEMNHLYATLPWKKGYKHLDGEYRRIMVQFVLDHLDVVNGELVYDSDDVIWVGTAHVTAAAGVREAPIRVVNAPHDLDDVYEPK